MKYYRTIVLSAAEEAEYRKFMMRNENYTLRLANFMAVIYSFAFLIIDYWRADNFVFVLLHRSMMILFAGSLVIYLTQKPILSIKALDIICTLVCFYWVVLSLSLDYTSGMPNFFLPNFICLMFYIFNAGFGHHMKLKSMLTAVFVILFISYAFFVSRHQNFHASQAWNVILNGVVSLFIGFLIERYKRLNYVQRLELISNRNKVEEMNSVKSKLISILSHDLNSPLNKLKSLLQLSEKGLINQEELRLYFEKVGRSVDGVSLMLSNLVRWSKSQLQGFRPEPEKINAQVFVADVIYSLEPIAAEKNIQIQNNVQDNISLFVDQEMAKLIVRNILTNSLKFSYPDSTVAISSRKNLEHCTLVIQDFGIGMSPEDLKNLFSLKKISQKGTQNEGGTGIGLMLTKEFIEINGGTISVESSEGKGSTFFVNFPIAKN